MKGKKDRKPNPIWAEIDLDAIVHNFQAVRNLIKPETKIMAVVKADAYGHGVMNVARVLKAEGAEAIGVARLCEAIALREAGIEQLILVFGYTPPSAACDLLKYDIAQTVFSPSYALALNQKARMSDGCVKIHIKIDTGMGRLGLMPVELGGEGDQNSMTTETICGTVKEIADLDNLKVEGIYTHFAASDSADKASARAQLALFERVLAQLEATGINTSLIHAANSGAIINLPEAHFNMVRPGIMLYGLYPSDEVALDKVTLKPAMQLKARIAQIKNVPKGFKVSYGHTYITPCATRIATVPIGYADGYNRQLSSCGVMLVGGRLAPVIGRVCMDQTMLDVGHIEGVRPGDEVVIFGQQGETTLTVESMAQQLGTINYEIVATLMARVPRIIV